MYVKLNYDRPKRVFLNILFIILLLSLHCNAGLEFEVEVFKEYNNLFSQKTNWIGADGDYSVAINDNVTLWLYGDTFIGDIQDGKRINSIIVNNSIALQYGKDPKTATVKFFYGKTKDGKPDAFIKPANGKGWFWPYHGVMIKKGLYLFLMQIERTDEESVFGFKYTGSSIGYVSNISESPALWKIKQFTIPWCYGSSTGSLLFGSALLHDKNFIYIYGVSEEGKEASRQKYMILARVPEESISDFGKWRFFTQKGWEQDFRKALRLLSGIANEYSVSYQPLLQEYILVYTENGMSKNIVARLSKNPYGPWSKPVTLYQCPEVNWGKNILCYAAKAHPALSETSSSLIITYITNAMDLNLLYKDARLYFPRFLKVLFKRHN